MAKKSKKSRGSNEIGLDGGAAVTLLSLSKIAKKEPSTAEGLDEGAGRNVRGDDSDGCNPPEVPDLCIPPLEKQKKKKQKNRDTVDVGLSGEEIEEKKQKRKSSSDTIGTELNGEEEKEMKKKRKRTSDTINTGLNGEEEKEKKKKKKKKRKSISDTIDTGLNGDEGKEKKKKQRKSSSDIVDARLSNELEEEMKKQNSSSDTVDAWLSSLEDKEKKKKKKKKKKKRMSSRDTGDGGLNGEGKMGKKKKKKGKGASNDVELKNASRGQSNGGVVEEDGEVKQDVSIGLSEDPCPPRKKKMKRKRAHDDAGGDAVVNRNPAGRTESKEGISVGDAAVAVSRRKKTVRFQEQSNDVPDENVTHVLCEGMEDDIEYFSEGRNWRKDIQKPGLHYGKFTKEEDEKLKTAVLNYIKMRGWGDKGLQIVLHSSQHQAIARGCWLEIAKCLPDRPVKQINSRAMRLLGGHKRGKWSAEELEVLTNLQKIHGNNWTKIASHMDRSADVCKDKWRHSKLYPTRKTGPWQQDELDMLCKLVRRSLKVKASLPAKQIDRREVRDDINWEWICEQMQRDSSICADVWYHKLASPMIWAEKWAIGDDRLLLQRLMELGAASEEAVDWETILDHREGKFSEGRWKEMTKLLGKSDPVSFEDKLELLARRYAPDLVGNEEEI